MKVATPLALAALLATAAPMAARAQADTATAPADSLAVAGAVAAFHAALAAGDSTGALALLAPDAVVLEGGELETRAQYAAHHLAADIAFAQAIPGERAVIGVRRVGDSAWLWATSTARGTWKDRAIDSLGAELMVLSRHGEGWRIRAIHWSSRKR